MPPIAQPKLVNRGPAGLLTKLPSNGEVKKVETQRSESFNKITPDLEHMTVDIDKLIPDPMNARLHPERNLESIKDSLATFGQVKPVVVREQTNVVVAGNGTMAAAKALGWTKIAATFVEMTDEEAASYGLADNRTAELARWDFEIVSRLDKLIKESENPNPMIGWSLDELQVLRAAEWTPPAITDNPGGTGKEKPLVIGFTPDQYGVIGAIIELYRLKHDLPDDTDDAVVLLGICEEWEKQ